jgi:hypothetical protein
MCYQHTHLSLKLGGSMPEQPESGIGTTGGAQFESPLGLWIAIWQRQLVYRRA